MPAVIQYNEGSITEFVTARSRASKNNLAPAKEDRESISYGPFVDANGNMTMYQLNFGCKNQIEGFYSGFDGRKHMHFMVSTTDCGVQTGASMMDALRELRTQLTINGHPVEEWHVICWDKAPAHCSPEVFITVIGPFTLNDQSTNFLMLKRSP